jgi:hypothetical protein
VTVCGEVLAPEAAMATAVYTVVCVGESVTLPESCELFTTVRDALPALAVMVTEEAFVACHVRVTL